MQCQMLLLQRITQTSLICQSHQRTMTATLSYGIKFGVLARMRGADV